MDTRVVVSLLCIVMLVAWWGIEAMVDALEYRHGFHRSALAAALLTAAIVAGNPVWLFYTVLSVIASGTAWNLIYYLRIRR